MSDGKTHYKYYMRGYWVSVPISVATAFLDWRAGLGYLVGYSMHRYVDNDWDIFGSNNAEGRLVNEIPLLGHFLYGISSVYGSIFRKHHRSWMTHWPIVSTLGRLMFLLFIPLVVGDGYGINFIGNGWIWFWVGMWGGLSHADGIHFYHDIVNSKE
jgi:hypothetical protein